RLRHPRRRPAVVGGRCRPGRLPAATRRAGHPPGQRPHPRGERRGGVARFDRPMLEALGVQKLTTSSAWTTGPTEFEGVLASAVLDAVGAVGTAVHATALNDYAVTIPIDELRRYPVLLALKMNGQYLKIMDKGPV